MASSWTDKQYSADSCRGWRAIRDGTIVHRVTRTEGLACGIVRNMRFSSLSLMALVLGSSFALAQSSSPVRMCTATPTPAWCQAVRGDRSEGWLPQTRSEVMARNGLVTTVQPLAAEAGLRILNQGGNAIDAAVAAAAVLNVVYPAKT